MLNIKEPKPEDKWKNYLEDEKLKKCIKDIEDKVKPRLDEAKRCNQIAQQLFPNRPFFAAMSIFFMEYEMILTEDIEKRQILLKQMEKAIGIVDFYDDKSDLSKVVRNEYDGIKGWLEPLGTGTNGSNNCPNGLKVCPLWLYLSIMT